jgi:hypothetical protein
MSTTRLLGYSGFRGSWFKGLKRFEEFSRFDC